MSSPTLLAHAVQRIAARTVGKSQPDLVGLVESWADIVGEMWAARTTPIGWTPARAGRAAELKLAVLPGEALLVEHETPALLSRINGFLGAGAIGTIRIKKIEKTADNLEKKKRIRTLKPLPVEGIDDPELAEILGRLGAAIKSATRERGRED